MTLSLRSRGSPKATMFRGRGRSLTDGAGGYRLELSEEELFGYLEKAS
jgi:hypothetical protein